MSEADKATAIQTDSVSELTCQKCQSVLDVSSIASFSEIDCPACGNKLVVPAQLGVFRLSRLLGTGGMGAIYQGTDDALGRDVAIKVMLKSLGSDSEMVETFMREARMAAALNHPNVVQIYSVSQEKGQPYIVMELVQGKTLETIMNHTGPMQEDIAIGIALDVAKGLSAGFEIGLIHGDVKPRNILVDTKGTAKVVDFGLATFVDKQASEHGGVWGTPYYIAPEKVLKQPIDARSDIYSLGATLYHAIAGVPPFEGKTPIDVVKARLSRPPRPLSVVRKQVLPRLNSIVMRMLEDKPAKRYPNYASVMGDLEQALKEVEKTPDSPALQAARIAMVKRPKTTRQPQPEGLSLPEPQETPAPVSSSIPATSAAPASKLIINLKTRKPRTAEPDEPSEEEIEQMRLNEARRKKLKRQVLVTFLTVFGVVAIGVLAVLAINWKKTEDQKRFEIQQVLTAIETDYEVFAPLGKFAADAKGVKDKIEPIPAKYKKQGRPGAAKLATDAVNLAEEATLKAVELEKVIKSAAQAMTAAQRAKTPAEASAEKSKILECARKATALRVEVARLLNEMGQLLTKADAEPGLPVNELPQVHE